MITTTFEDDLRLHGRFIFTSQGTSMWPLIRPGRDALEISARTVPIKKYDTVLYRDGRGRYVLHRVIRIHRASTEDTYDILGDNNCSFECGVRDSQIIAVLTSVLRDGTKRVDFDSVFYKAYICLWCRLYPSRIAMLWLLNTAKTLCRGILRRS